MPDYARKFSLILALQVTCRHVPCKSWRIQTEWGGGAQILVASHRWATSIAVHSPAFPAITFGPGPPSVHLAYHNPQGRLLPPNHYDLVHAAGPGPPPPCILVEETPHAGPASLRDSVLDSAMVPREGPRFPLGAHTPLVGPSSSRESPGLPYPITAPAGHLSSRQHRDGLETECATFCPNGPGS